MESNKKPSSSEKNKKPSPHGGSYMWYLLGLGVLLLLMVTIFTNSSKKEIAWSDLVQLVKQSKQTESGDEEYRHWIEIEDTSSKTPKRVKLANLSDVMVSTSKVTGTVEWIEIDRETGEAIPGERGSLERPFVSYRDHNDDQILELLGQTEITHRVAQPADPLLSNLMWFAVFIGMIVLFLLLLRRMGGAGSPMAFGRSRGKLYAQEDIDVTFDDVAGIEEAVDELREVVDFLRNPERYQSLGGRIPKGVLLVGPPGTGKTLLGKAVAGEAGVPFFSLSGSDFVEMFVGVGAARVRDMFQQAEQRAPCIVFIDELDALGKTRGSGNMGGHDEREQTLNALLVEMDGFGTNSGIIIMGATNRPETLDPALMRPGRFDRHVLVDRPDIAGREEIIEVHLQNIKVDADVDVKSLAAITSGFVGADLANVVNEAALLAARNGKEVVTMEEFNEAVERSSAGLEKKSRIIRDDEKQRVAFHEAGHALVAYSLPNTDPVHKVSIIPRGLAALGYMMQRPSEDRFLMTQSELESRIQVCLAGTVAEEMVFDDVSSGAQNDLERATEMARSMVMDYGMSRLGRVNYRDSNRSAFLAGSDGPRMQHHSEQTAREIDQEVKRIIDEGLERTRHILETRRPVLENITKSLLKYEVIDSEQLKELIEQSSSSPRIVPGTDSERKNQQAGGSEPAADGDAASG
ncbi:ATP-dependent zinc metalloprotease FtsH 4 [Posidoniimonas polymericola]|uniref:ATP-dependent zinc metalloprotease FtsH n=1 Tax=Posidoniimonas polymericola TaxID=2528002 RepID=A0A5C5YUB4_9BACT|nr:ATP-dependent zinc metalloprotease FtsH [Posidoniimonas polymericola]TWT78568.1 ATP-dependent zinc metalloprotease FtsH 4 [Posidoniimonas polymericola]